MARKKKSNLLSKERRLNNLYKIVDKNGKTVTFKMNKTQKILFELQKKYPRIIILKARQLGMSTYKIIEGLDKALFYGNQTCIITAHKQDKLKELFEKAKFAYDMLPKKIKMADGRVWEKPSAHYNSANELFFKGSNNSKIKVSLDSRSGTPTNLHITELAFMKNAKEMWTGSMPSIPKNAPVTVETTANGLNFFSDLWNKYYGKENGAFKTVFFPWYDDKGYTLKTYHGKIPEELNHLKKLGLTQGQINWYANQYELLGKEVFQEYPSVPEEAFLTTGNPVFNTNKLKALPVLKYKTDLKYADLRIYGKPEKDCVYGIDTSEGGADGDLSVITVRNRDYKLLACYIGHIPPDDLGEVVEYIYNLGYKTTGATVGVESNNTGIATLDYLKKTKIAKVLYCQTKVDEKTKKKTKKLGFNTNLKTRPLIISNIEEAIRKDLLTELDERAKKDFFYFIYNEKNKPEAMKGKHDDAVLSDAICLFMTTQPKQIVFG